MLHTPGPGLRRPVQVRIGHHPNEPLPIPMRRVASFPVFRICLADPSADKRHREGHREKECNGFRFRRSPALLMRRMRELSKRLVSSPAGQLELTVRSTDEEDVATVGHHPITFRPMGRRKPSGGRGWMRSDQLTSCERAALALPTTWATAQITSRSVRTRMEDDAGEPLRGIPCMSGTSPRLAGQGHCREVAPGPRGETSAGRRSSAMTCAGFGASG